MRSRALAFESDAAAGEADAGDEAAAGGALTGAAAGAGCAPSVRRPPRPARCSGTAWRSGVRTRGASAEPAGAITADAGTGGGLVVLVGVAAGESTGAALAG